MHDKEPQESLEARLRATEAAKAGLYEKRTEHLDAAGNTLFINRLILEDSPYLLQHAHNPVNWYAWGAEAFAAAESADKPIFLSIGYSTCHWCHVMEVESFDNVDVATILNQHFVSIKLDREQFPDIDEVYMTGVQIMSGQGGWPMSNFLLPDGKPFFGATYFPAASFMQLLQQVADAWRTRRAELSSSAAQVSQAIARILSERKPPVALDPQLSESMLQALLQREDRTFGGLAGAPKFPQEPLLLLLLDRARRNRELESQAFIERALTGMAGGGIYDQVAGGFHRYSVDGQWLVPHFEKMLYNQSQLGLVYLQAWELTYDPFFQRICKQTLDYVVRDMQLPEGGFYSATDADSEGEEGTFFVWRIEELQALLQPAQVALVTAVYDISDGGNFEGANILSLRKPLGELAAESGRDDFYPALDQVLQKLYLAREQRVHPLRDDKLIVAWTSAMISTLARAAYAMANPDWLLAAERAAQLVWAQNVDSAQQPLRLHRIYLDGATSINGQLEDYASFTEALLTLHDITTNRSYLDQARQLFASAIEEFWDAENGCFYLSPAQHDGPQLTRSRSASDGAILSAAAIALQCMITLEHSSAIGDLEAWPELADLQGRINTCVTALSGALNDNPLSHPSLLRAIASLQRGSAEAVQYAGAGRARVAVRRLHHATQRHEVEVTLSMQPGWHVTAPTVSTGSFEPLQLHIADEETHWQLEACDFPAADTVLPDPAGTEVPIYEDRVIFLARFVSVAEAADALAGSAGFCVRVQLCNAQNCLLPEDLYFRC